jgi:hypothetical protein
MQVLRINRWDDRFYCPVTGQRVLNEQLEPSAPTFRGLWFTEVIDEPTIVLPELESAWIQYVAQAGASEEDDTIDLEDFLSKYESDSLVAFCFTSHSMACGPVAETVWIVLDLSIEIDDEEPNSLE